MIFIICFGLFAMGLYILLTLIKNEKRRNNWLPNMKVGDDVNFSTLNNNVNAVITDLSPTNDEDIIEVKVLVSKKSLYPGKSREISNTIL
jgi:hypothetical protein